MKLRSYIKLQLFYQQNSDNNGCIIESTELKLLIYYILSMLMSGAIGGFAQSADRAARFADTHIAQLICRSRSYRKIAQA